MVNTWQIPGERRDMDKKAKLLTTFFLGFGFGFGLPRKVAGS